MAEAVFDTAYNQTRSLNGYGEVSNVEITVSNTPVHDCYLTRSDTGRITDKQQNNFNFHYEYDQLGRLLKVNENNILKEEYRYDANGNRTYELNAARNISGRIYDYSDGDHLLTAGDVTYHYDVDGYLVERVQGGETTSYTYSTRGELLEVTQPDGTLIEYLHDPLGRRIAKLVNGAVTEKYLWSGPTTLLAVYDGNDNLKIRFEYTDERMPPAMTKNGTRYYLAYDQVGTLKRVIDPSGNVVKELTQDTFGNIITDSSPGFTIPFGFAGGFHGPDTNLIRFGARDYAPEIGRWTAKDPILFGGGDTNLYGYVLGDPVGDVNPDGLEVGDLAESEI